VTVQDVIKVHPRPSGLDRDALLRCVAECYDCGPSCTACADASLAESDLSELVRCVRLCFDCADTCESTGRILIRQTDANLQVVRATLEASTAACRTCRVECERHAHHHEHCRLCAEACKRCEEACETLAATIG
jgi:hypothetical protein